MSFLVDREVVCATTAGPSVIVAAENIGLYCQISIGEYQTYIATYVDW